MRPAYDFGDEVRVLRNLRNDGTYPGVDRGSLLIRRGCVGVVRDIGTFLQDQIIYSVHFLEAGKIVGCREQELQPAAAPWVPSRFEVREKVVAGLRLGSGGRVLVEQGQVGEVTAVLRQLAEGVAYHVQFPGCNLIQVPESALDAVDDDGDDGDEAAAEDLAVSHDQRPSASEGLLEAHPRRSLVQQEQGPLGLRDQSVSDR
jgi:nitrogen fixation protein NifZ